MSHKVGIKAGYEFKSPGAAKGHCSSLVRSIKSINKALQPLTEFTDVSVSFVMPVLHLFRSSILKAQDDESDLTCTIKNKIMTYLDDKYNDPLTQELLGLAS